MESSRVQAMELFYATGMEQPPCRRRCVCEAYQEKSRSLFLAMYRMRKYAWLRKQHHTQCLFRNVSFPYFRVLCRYEPEDCRAFEAGYRLSPHGGIDCCNSTADCVEQLLPLFSLPNIEITGMYTHLVYGAGSNQRELAFTELQYQRFQSCIRALQERRIDTGIVHICNSKAAIHAPAICIWTWCVSVP